MFDEKFESPELEAVMQRLQPLRADRQKFNSQLDALGPQLVDAESRVHLAQKRLAQGDKEAGAELEKLDLALKALRHKHDGLGMTLAEIDQKIRPLQAQADAIRQRFARQADEETFKTCEARLVARYDNAFTKLSEASQALGEWRVEEMQFRQHFGQRAAVVIDQLNQGPMVNPMSQLIHIRKWQKVHASSYAIAPLLPPANGQAQTATQSR